MFDKELKIDMDDLDSAIRKYDDIISEFEQAVKDTEKAMASLKSSGWKSSASVAYFKHYEDTWKSNMEKRIKIIKHLKDCLEKANKEYDSVCDELETLADALN